jgi:hypothetical protein
MIYLAIALFLLSVLAKSNCDKKAFREGGVERSDGRGWIVKTALSFLLGKWHRWDAVRVMVLCIAIILCTNISVFWALPLYLIHGLIFEIFYNYVK